MYILVIFIFLVLYLSERIKNEKLLKINKELREVHYGAYKTINKNKWQESINIYFKKDEI